MISKSKITIQKQNPIFAKHPFMKKVHFLLILSSSVSGVFAQVSSEINTVTTMVPFLTITPDSRSAGLGDAGVALFSPDANSVSWNMSNLVNADKKAGFSLSYAPWLRQLVSDVGFSYLSGYTKTKSGNSVIGGAVRYFSLGNINFTDFEGNPIGNFNPNVKAGVSGAGDVNLLYKTKIKMQGGKNSDFNFGVNIQNIGAKMTYTTREQRDFIPTNLKMGVGWKYELDQYNKIGVYADVNKLLVPTRPFYLVSYDGSDSTINNVRQFIGKDPNVSVVQGMVQSFYDAPGGFSEEINEWTGSFGTEYWYDNKFAARVGAFYENNKKGGRQYATFGLGLKYQKLTIDLAMLVPFARRHPLQNQLRFSLLFDMGAFSDKE
jgi:hypothetical protein